MWQNRDAGGVAFCQPIKSYLCDQCDKEICESSPRYSNAGEDYCTRCAFILGLVGDRFLLSCHGFDEDMFRAAINPGTGDIAITYRKSKFPWERTPAQERHSPEYSVWRTAVFERDEYTCQKCSQKGGTLNAHHIKSFKKYPKLRYVVSNGITYCEKCHREVHKKRVRQ